MLPLLIYELLPYIYLGVGAVGFAFYDSDLISIASGLIVLAGFIVIWMRIDYRRNVLTPSVSKGLYIKRSKQDRRKNKRASFPLMDVLGTVVNEDRRSGERRMVTA